MEPEILLEQDHGCLRIKITTHRNEKWSNCEGVPSVSKRYGGPVRSDSVYILTPNLYVFARTHVVSSDLSNDWTSVFIAQCREQALILEPAGELRFKGPFTDVVTADLNLTNPTEKRICFKVKTTAPKRYCVRPNSGILEPKKSIVVAVMLQPFEYDPTEKNKHKFMVQSMFAPDHVVDNQEVLWRDAPPESLMDTKLKCVFEMPDGVQQPTTDTSKLTEAAAHYSESNLEEPSFARKVESPKKTLSNSGDELKKLQLELKKVQNELQSVRSENIQLKEDGARLRKVAMADTVSSTPSHPPPTSTNNIQAFPPVMVSVLLEEKQRTRKLGH
ncbi:hypothetical protein Btru_011742 [Bulinus truncatus]|nr:hypothetical protein Btru_011742 [Bulinus truncatus]